MTILLPISIGPGEVILSRSLLLVATEVDVILPETDS
jgi:hypothetical protein